MEWSCVLSVGVCCVSGVTVDTDEHWCSQINRLQQLIDKLECQVNASKCPFTQNNLYVFSMYIEILVCFSFLESKVGATERRYTGQHIQISEFSDPRFRSIYRINSWISSWLTMCHLRTHLSWLKCLNIDMLMVLSPVAMEELVSLAPRMTGSSDFIVLIWNFLVFFHISDEVVAVWFAAQ